MTIEEKKKIMLEMSKAIYITNRCARIVLATILSIVYIGHIITNLQYKR